MESYQMVSSKTISSLKKLGNIRQIASAQTFTYSGGRMDGIRACRVENGGGLEFTVLLSNCLDLYYLKFKGVNLSFLSKPGVQSPVYFNPHGFEHHRFFHAGMTYTCGLGNIGASCLEGEREYNFHGRISQSPADHISVAEYWENDKYFIEISGEMREASHYGENLVLQRKITTQMGSNKLKIFDRVINQGYEPEPVMLLYHINFGYPLLDHHARIVLPRGDVYTKQCGTEHAKADMLSVSDPIDYAEADVFYHRSNSDKDGYSYAGIINDHLGLCLYERYQTKNLPMLAQWKSMRSGEYAVALEPCSQFPENRMTERKKGGLNYLQPMESAEFEIELNVLDTAQSISDFEAMIHSL